MKTLFIVILIIGNCSLSLSQKTTTIPFNGVSWSLSYSDHQKTNLLLANNVLDSSLLIESMEGALVENKGFRIPTSKEIIQTLESSYSIPERIRKVKCEKTYHCSRDGYYYGMGKNHPHNCKNCENWPYEYRKRVACHICKDIRVTYCGKTVICSSCNGKGYWNHVLPANSELSLEEYLREWEKGNNSSIILYRYGFYFDDPSDFGLIDLRSKKKISFNTSNGWENKLNDEYLSLLLIQGSGTVRQRIATHNEQIDKSDQEKIARIKQLQSQITNSDSDITVLNEITATYDQIKFTKNKSLIYYSIQKSIQDYSSGKSIKMSFTSLSLIINNNKEQFKDLPSGNYTLKIDSYGNVLLNQNKLNIRVDSEQLVFNSFKSPVNSEILLTVKEYDKTNGPQKIMVSTDKKIFRKSNGKLYRRIFFDRGYKHEQVAVFYNPSISRNRYQLVQPTIVMKRINDQFELKAGEKDVIISEQRLKTKGFNVALKSLTILSGVSWLALRTYEYLLINQ